MKNTILAAILAAVAAFAVLQAYRHRKRADAAEKRANGLSSAAKGQKLDEAKAARQKADGHADLARAAEAEARIAVEKIRRLRHEKMADIVERWNSGLRSDS